MEASLKKQLRKEYFESQKNMPIIKLLFSIGIVILLGIYIGDTLFGKSSLNVLLILQDDKSRLKRRVVELKEENSILQKKYFELYQLDPSINKKELR